MVELLGDAPLEGVLPGVGPAAAGAGEALGRGGVDGDGEQVGGFGEVGDEAAFDAGEVEEEEEVGEEDGEEHDVEGLFVGLGAPGGIFLRADERGDDLCGGVGEKPGF